jgi:hypothetical protein
VVQTEGLDGKLMYLDNLIFGIYQSSRIEGGGSMSVAGNKRAGFREGLSCFPEGTSGIPYWFSIPCISGLGNDTPPVAFRRTGLVYL